MNDAAILLQTLGIMVVSAAVMMLLLKPLKLPTIVVCTVAGLLVGPITGLLDAGQRGDADGEVARAVDQSIEGISHFGIVLLLFLVGLELSLDRLRDLGRVTLLGGVGHVIVTTTLGFLLSLLLGIPMVAAILVAFAMTLSSTVVVIRLLEQRRELTSLHGRISVGILLIEDLTVILALTILASIQPGETPDLLAAARRLPLALVATAGLLGLAILASRHLLARPFGFAARRPETLVAWGLGWCLVFVVLAKLLGLSAEIGAFLAGISLAQLPSAGDLNRRLHPLMNFFIAVFFVSLGAGIDLRAATAQLPTVLVLAAFVMLAKPLLVAFLLGRLGMGGRSAMLAGLCLGQVSEFSFVFAALAAKTGLLDEAMVGVIAAVGLLTILLSAWVIQHADPIAGWLAARGVPRLLRLPPEPPAPTVPEAHGHVLVVGMNAMGRRVVDALVAAGEQVIAIDSDLAKLRGRPCRVLHGDIDDLHLLEGAGLDRARLVVTALQIEPVNRLLAFRCRERGVPCIVHAFDGSLVPDLERLGVDHLVDSKMQGNLRVVSILAEEGIARP